MDRRRIKFLLLAAGVVATMGVLLAVGITQTDGLQRYITVSEFVDGGGKSVRGVRVKGIVAEGSIERLPTGQDVKFLITDGGTAMPVSYHGIVPDTFVDRAEVVLEGTLQADGSFQADTLLAKCPSKYEAADGAEQAEGYAAGAEAAAR